MPKVVNFGKIARDAKPEQLKRTVTITRGDGGPLKLKLKPVKTKGVEAKLKELKPGERYELEIALTPPFASERVHTRISLETGLPKAPTA